MTQLTNYNLWIFRGLECGTTASERPLHRGQPLDAASWYVGHAPGGEIASGPFPSERHAVLDAQLMTDTSGT
jgi:hypothetical protein